MENPEYTSFISVNPLSLSEIQSLMDKDTVIIEYFLGKDNSYLWIIGRDNFNSVILNFTEKEITEQVKTCREMICEDMTTKKITDNRWRIISQKLYNMLLKDLEKYLKGKKIILIAPHRILYYLPFQILIDNTGRLFVEKYETGYLPSASVLKYCQDKNKFRKESLLAFELGNMKIGDLSPLPGTEDEIKAIIPYFHKNEIYAASHMTTDILYEKGDKFDILHFATHSILDSASPLFSSLVFSDRKLNVYEIFDLNLKSYLICLSACRTGLGEETNGDEFVGLSRAFIYAGTPSICSSLWDVSDVSTAKLMERFYYYLRHNNKTEAMRLAQLDIIKAYPHPFFWAPFVLTGDWR
jgi:CHAT domain-containing protein